ncbi:hypothetical protein [Alkalihalobacterium alkalinitrilicum]|nr:hypothetical protein [Alkalihalobacterium alkalinitrilicum]
MSNQEWLEWQKRIVFEEYIKPELEKDENEEKKNAEQKHFQKNEEVITL